MISKLVAHKTAEELTGKFKSLFLYFKVNYEWNEADKSFRLFENDPNFNLSALPTLKKCAMPTLEKLLIVKCLAANMKGER